MATLDATHFITKVEIIDEIQDLMCWNRRKNDLKYLHFVQYSHEDLNPNKQGDEFEGRIRVMLTQLTEVKDVCRAIQVKQEDTFAAIKKVKDNTYQQLETKQT